VRRILTYMRRRILTCVRTGTLSCGDKAVIAQKLLGILAEAGCPV
jgi:hypothetical protein